MPQLDPTKILMVDDVDMNLVALEALLRDDSLALIKANTGPEALELLLVHEFGLALLDVQMPGMDGFELAELMRGTERTRSIPIIFITAVATDERRRFRGYEAGAVDYLLKPFDPATLKGKVAIFAELHRQRRDLARQRDELRASADQLSAALARIQAHSDNSPLAIVEFDPALRILTWSNGAERMFGWSATNALGRTPTEFGWIRKDDEEQFRAVLSEMISGRAPRAVHANRAFHRDGSLVECEWYHSILRDRASRPLSINSQILDITERTRAAETQRLLVGELNHRVKNTLATVQAIATQTLRYTEEPKAFAKDFSGRIQSLARAHSLLSDATWKGASLLTLIEDQLRLGAIDERRLTTSGPDLILAPQVALHLAMILHELITNANKYGALATSQGRIDLSWTIDEGRIHLVWIESGVPGLRAPSRRGFGTTLIEQSAKSDGGTATVIYRADGLTWNLWLTVPEQPNEFAHQTARHAPEKPVQAISLLPPKSAGLAGTRFVLIEDEPLVALQIANVLEDAGVSVIGVAGTADQALRLIEGAVCDGAFLDANLHGRAVDDIAAALTRRGIPFAFVSGYGRDSLPRAFANAAAITKPFESDGLLRTAEKIVHSRRDIFPLRRGS